MLDGRTVIDVPQLRAALAVWQYAEASARLIFREEEATDPLGKVLLDKITATPGMSMRKSWSRLWERLPTTARYARKS